MHETPEITNSDATSAAENAPAMDTDQQEPTLEQRLKEAELSAQEHHDAWLRASAEADNIRKRSQTEIANAHKFARRELRRPSCCPVKDSLEAALAAENATVESMRSGVELTLNQLTAVFEKFSVKEIDPAGQKFDPHRHQAISTVESDAEPNTVVQVLQKGLSAARPRGPSGAGDRRQVQSR